MGNHFLILGKYLRFLKNFLSQTGTESENLEKLSWINKHEKNVISGQSKHFVLMLLKRPRFNFQPFFSIISSNFKMKSHFKLDNQNLSFQKCWNGTFWQYQNFFFKNVSNWEINQNWPFPINSFDFHKLTFFNGKMVFKKIPDKLSWLVIWQWSVFPT